ncbi:uncharacterized protein LOC111130205 [Crassostrea virginica]
MAEGFVDVQELWIQQADNDAQNNRDLRHQHGMGPYNIFILDTSSYIGEDGMNEIKETFATLMKEYTKQSDIDENIAVIVCGRRTRFLRYFSNQYEDMSHCLDQLEFGGGCPLAAAVILASRSLQNGRTYIINEYNIHPRLILVSAGRSTDYTMTESVEPEESIEPDEDKKLLSVSRDLGRIYPIFCIPVGRSPNMTILEFISGQSRGGKIVCSNNAAQLAKLSVNMTIASKLPFTINNDGNDRERILTSLACTFPDRDFTENDQKDICEICLQKSLYRPIGDIYSEIEKEDDVCQERDPRMPPLGARVNRGRDWKWGDQDKNGPGTVVGHLRQDGWLNVQWDRNLGSTRGYRYGSTRDEGDKYDVKVCDEPRILENEIIAPGCLVTRGADWSYDDQDGGAGNIGSVVRVKNCGLVLVRWTNGNIKDYSYGYHGEFDLQICDPLSLETKKFLQKQMESQAALNYYQGCTDSENGSSLSKSVDTDFGKTSLGDSSVKSILPVKKGKYFKNEKGEQPSDIETNCMKPPGSSNQWLWKGTEGKWNSYSTEMNDRLNKCFKRAPKSTVVVTIQGQSYRVVMAKRVQIKLTTRETFEVKLVQNE